VLNELWNDGRAYRMLPSRSLHDFDDSPPDNRFYGFAPRDFDRRSHCHFWCVTPRSLVDVRMPAAIYDLPPLYDLIVRPGPCETFYRQVARHTGGPVLELACGTGRLKTMMVVNSAICCQPATVYGEMSSGAESASTRSPRSA
jgi:hypothetical protein